MNADEIRSKITETFEQFKPQLDGYHEYAQRITALSEEYHKVRLAETFCLPEEMIFVCTLNAAETPKSLDQKLAQLNQAGTKIKRIIYDRKERSYYLFA
jgi:hypothetical protein